MSVRYVDERVIVTGQGDFKPWPTLDEIKNPTDFVGYDHALDFADQTDQTRTIATRAFHTLTRFALGAYKPGRAHGPLEMRIAEELDLQNRVDAGFAPVDRSYLRQKPRAGDSRDDFIMRAGGIASVARQLEKSKALPTRFNGLGDKGLEFLGSIATLLEVQFEENQ